MIPNRNESRNYSVQDYDPLWPEQFERIRTFLEDVFGEKTVGIEHVGSTSIPGMCAKPVIDVAVLVDEMEGFTQEKNRMTSEGYLWREDYVAPGTLLFWRESEDGSRRENIHICRAGSATARQFLAIRDFLRAFPRKAEEYRDIKTESYRLHPNDYHSYRKAKSPFLQRLEQEAYAWQNRKGTDAGRESNLF